MKTPLKRAKSSSSAMLSLWNGEEISTDEYALNSQPQLQTAEIPRGFFSTPKATKVLSRRLSVCQRKTKKRKINLKKQIRRSVQKFNRQSKAKVDAQIKKLQHLGFEVERLSVPKLSCEASADSQGKDDSPELDESVRTKKKFLNCPAKRTPWPARTRLREKLKAQSRKIKHRLKQKIFCKVTDFGQTKALKVRAKARRLKVFVYDNAVVHRNPASHLGVILFQTGDIFFGKLGLGNRPHGRGILFSGKGDFICGDFAKGLLTGKALTNDPRFLRKRESECRESVEQGMLYNFPNQMLCPRSNQRRKTRLVCNRGAGLNGHIVF